MKMRTCPHNYEYESIAAAVGILKKKTLSETFRLVFVTFSSLFI